MKINTPQFILDCSMTMAWCFDDEKTDSSEKVFDMLLDKEAIVPSIWPLEVVNVLVIACRKKRIDQIKAASFIDRLSELPIIVASSKPISSMNSNFQLSIKRKLTSYDASYLNLAVSRGVPIATLDVDLQKAAKATGIQVIK